MDILDLSVGEKKNKRKAIAPQRRPSDEIEGNGPGADIIQPSSNSPLQPSVHLMGKIFETVKHNGSFERSPISVYGSRMATSDDDTEVSSISSHKQGGRGGWYTY